MENSVVEWFANRIKSDKIFNFENVLNQAKQMEKEKMILLVEQLKDYTREAQCILGNDEREASEFVDIFLQQNNKSK